MIFMIFMIIKIITYHIIFCYEGTRTCAACWTALWHLDALYCEGCEGHGSANGLLQPIMELAEKAINRPIGQELF